MTRIQKERFPDVDEYIKVAGIYKMTANKTKLMPIYTPDILCFFNASYLQLE